MKPIILFQIYVLVYVILDALHDSYVVKDRNALGEGKTIKLPWKTMDRRMFHNRMWHIVDSFVVCLHALMVSFLLLQPFKEYIVFRGTIWEIGWAAVLITLWRFMTFNYAYNIFMKQPLVYRSNKGLDSLPYRNFINMGVFFIIIVLNVYFWQ